MALYVTEHPSDPTYRQPATKALVTGYIMSSASTGAHTPAAGTKYIRVSADGSGGTTGMFLNLSTSSTGLLLSSTNSYRIPPNAPPELFSIVSTTFLIQATAAPT